MLEGYGVGAVDYLTKPVNPEVLRSKVAVFVGLHRMNLALAAANAALEHEVAQRLRAEDSLRRANHELEARVLARTDELTAANAALQGQRGPAAPRGGPRLGLPSRTWTARTSSASSTRPMRRAMD
ncbi:MAG: hypothetical protein WDM96_19230 [Lacunisphaera sp.]